MRSGRRSQITEQRKQKGSEIQHPPFGDDGTGRHSIGGQLEGILAPLEGGPFGGQGVLWTTIGLLIRLFNKPNLNYNIPSM